MQALVLAGHGSHLDPGTAEPVLDHAERIRERGVFDEVRAAFWKEEPALREVLRTLESGTVYVVPVLTSEGYFADRVFPRELRIADGWELDVDKAVRYTPPVGTHDAMTDAIVRRAESVTGDPDVGEGVGLAIVGHGTERSETSARSARRHAERIRDRGRFEEVRAFFLDQSPSVGDAVGAFGTDSIVVVPLFVADGHHTTGDIPAALGLTPDGSGGYENPSDVGGRRVRYAGAVGTEPRVADVAVERAIEAGARPDGDAQGAPDREVTAARRSFLRWVERADELGVRERRGALRSGITREWGELAVTARLRDGARRYEVRHRDDRDADPGALDAYADPNAVERRVRFDDGGRFRPLRGERTLPTGWTVGGLDGAGLVRAVEAVYPASIENWARERAGALDVTDFRAAADRQTGLYADVGDLPGEDLAAAVEAVCGNCAKRREWDGREGVEIPAERGDGAFPCREPCSFFVAALREFEDGDGEEPFGRYRERYESAKRRRAAIGEAP